MAHLDPGPSQDHRQGGPCCHLNGYNEPNLSTAPHLPRSATGRDTGHGSRAETCLAKGPEWLAGRAAAAGPQVDKQKVTRPGSVCAVRSTGPESVCAVPSTGPRPPCSVRPAGAERARGCECRSSHLLGPAPGLVIYGCLSNSRSRVCGKHNFIPAAHSSFKNVLLGTSSPALLVENSGRPHVFSAHSQATEKTLIKTLESISQHFPPSPSQVRAAAGSGMWLDPLFSPAVAPLLQ